MDVPTLDRRRPPGLAVFAILLASYAYTWHARDWNSASRFMLTYALVDRGTVSINGLEDQTRDRARVRSRYYSDKLPGFSLLAVPSYAVARLGLPPHPLGRRGFAYWPADYVVTLGTSGVLTAACGALLTWFAHRLGCGPRRSALVGLAYGLATPAYVYATMGYGHQATACFLLGSLLLVRVGGASSRPERLYFASGLLAASAVVVELQVAPVAAIVGSCVALGAIRRKISVGSVAAFAVGATGPTLVLLAYNVVAFGSPFDMGYFHEDLKDFSAVHSRANPLGLRLPDLDRAWPLLFGGYRGLFFHAPILILAPIGFVPLIRRDRVVGLGSLAACLAIFAVNLSYPEWTGGWSTGPRLLVPLIPFAMLAVAALLARGDRAIVATAIVLALFGGVLMFLFQGVGGQIPHFVADPLRGAVLPTWAGSPLAGWQTNGRFVRNAVSVLAPGWTARLSPRSAWLQLAPLAIGQALAIAALFTRRGPRPSRVGKGSPGPRTTPDPA